MVLTKAEECLREKYHTTTSFCGMKVCLPYPGVTSDSGSSHGVLLTITYSVFVFMMPV